MYCVFRNSRSKKMSTYYMKTAALEDERPTSLDRSGGYVKNDFVVDAYDWIVPHLTREDIPFFLNAISESQGHTLELGCGTGRVLIPIARAGFEITGMDLSNQMLSICRDKLAMESADTRSNVTALINCNMSDFSLRQHFDLVIIPFFTFNYLLTSTEQLSCLSSIRKHLKSSGKVILDLPNPRSCYLKEDIYLNEFGDEPHFEMPDGRKGRRKYRISSRDLEMQRLGIETIYYIINPDGAELRLVNEFVGHYLFAHDIESLMLRAGFEIDHIYGGFSREAYDPQTSEDMIVVAHKT